MKYYENLYNNKKDNKRLNNNINNCEYFCKNLYYDANFAATNFVVFSCIYLFFPVFILFYSTYEF